MPMQLVGTRSRAIRRRTSKNGANLKTGQADGQEPQLRERKSGFAEAAKRSVETCSAGRAGARPERVPTGAGGAARSYHFYGAYQRFNSNQKQRPSCQPSFSMRA